MERVEKCGEVARGKPLVVKVDVANGSSQRSVKAVKLLKNKYPWLHVFSGNVCTVEAAGIVADAGADGIMVGIGGGSACTTRGQTGIGMGNGHAVHEIAKRIRARNPGVTICADGGFRQPGDLMKAIALGADTCLSGRFFQTDASYYGMASETALEGTSKAQRACYEGATIQTEERQVVDVGRDIKGILGALRSAYSYLGYRSTQELRENAVHWNRISPGVYWESKAR
jgi:IMP dehydrogenase